MDGQRSIALSLAMLLGLGCSGLPDETPYTLSFGHPTSRQPFTLDVVGAPIAVTVGGREIFSWPEADSLQDCGPRQNLKCVVVSFSGAPFTNDNPTGPGPIALRMLTPSGWEDLALQVEVDGYYPLKEHHDNVREGSETMLRPGFRWPHPLFRLYVDNRGQDAATIAIGQFLLTVEADGVLVGGQVQMPLSDADAAVTINGNTVGTLEDLSSDLMPMFFIDTTGGKSYRLREIRYDGADAPPERRLRGRYLYTMGMALQSGWSPAYAAIDFLRPSPDSRPFFSETTPRVHLESPRLLRRLV